MESSPKTTKNLIKSWRMFKHPDPDPSVLSADAGIYIEKNIAPEWGPSIFCCESTYKMRDLELSTGSSGSSGFPQSGGSKCAPDPTFHTRRGPGWRELTQTPSNLVGAWNWVAKIPQVGIRLSSCSLRWSPRASHAWCHKLRKSCGLPHSSPPSADRSERHHVGPAYANRCEGSVFVEVAKQQQQ